MFCHFLVKQDDINSEKCIEYGKWRSKRAQLPDVNINTGVQSINIERGSLKERVPSICKVRVLFGAAFMFAVLFVFVFALAKVKLLLQK